MIARRYNAPVLGYVEPHKTPVPERAYEKVGRPPKKDRKAEIRALRRSGLKLREIAAMFGVKPQRISAICAGAD